MMSVFNITKMKENFVSRLFTNARASLQQIAETIIPSKKLSNKDLNREFGTTGDEISKGYIYNDYNSDLRGSAAVDVYDEMRRSDPTVAAVLKVVKLPIQNAKPIIKPFKVMDEDVKPEDDEIAKFIEQALFEKMDKTWDQFLGEALTCLDFGYSLFEKVYYPDGKNIWIKDLAFRRQQSIENWETLDGMAGVTQNLLYSSADNPENAQVSIPAEKLLVFSYRREGNNYEGLSLLREAYMPWKYKRTFYRFDAIRHERGAGFPITWAPEGASHDDIDELKTIVKNIRQTKETGVAFPGPRSSGWELEFVDTKALANSNLQKSIEHMNREITKIILAQWIELDGGGSYALQKDQSDFTVMVINGIARTIEDIINWHLIPELVDWNFETDNYPTFKFEEITKQSVNEAVTIINEAIGSGSVTKDIEVENVVREKLDLPAVTEEDLAKEQPNDVEKEEKETIKKEIKDEIEEEPKEEDILKQMSQFVDNNLIIELQKEYNEADLAKLKKKGLCFNTYEDKGWRPLTFAERKVNLNLIKDSLAKAEQKLNDSLDETIKKQKEDILRQVKKAVENNDIKSLDNLSVKYKSEIGQALTDVKLEMFELGKKTVSNEMDVPVPATNNNIKGVMRVENNQMVNQMSGAMENSAKLTVTQLTAKTAGNITNVSVASAINAVKDSLDKVVEKNKNTLLTLSITGGINMGRGSVYALHPDKVYALQYSAILDDRTTDRCLSLDGRIVKPGSQEEQMYTPPQHHNCRSIWVELLEDEFATQIIRQRNERTGEVEDVEFNPPRPKVTGIPGSIPPVTDINNAQELKKPVLLKNSMAIKVVQDEIASRQSKIDEYKASGMYQNRIDQHEKTIKRLESAIKGKFKEMIDWTLQDKK